MSLFQCVVGTFGSHVPQEVFSGGALSLDQKKGPTCRKRFKVSDVEAKGGQARDALFSDDPKKKFPSRSLRFFAGARTGYLMRWTAILVEKANEGSLTRVFETFEHKRAQGSNKQLDSMSAREHCASRQ